MSPFALPRLLRQILRCGTDLDDCDLKVAHVQMQLRRHDDMPVSKTYRDRRDERLKEIATTPWGLKAGEDEYARMEAAKEWMTSIVYEGDVPSDAGEFVTAFAAEQEMNRERDAADHPELLQLLAHKDRPQASLQCYLNMDEDTSIYLV